jgi:hypothetical protein
MPVFRNISFTNRTGANGLAHNDWATTTGPLYWLFSDGHMCSPVSRRALGECKASTGSGFGHSWLTSLGALGITFVLPLSPFLVRLASNSGVMPPGPPWPYRPLFCKPLMLNQAGAWNLSSQISDIKEQ